MATLAMLGHGRDARGTAALPVARGGTQELTLDALGSNMELTNKKAWWALSALWAAVIFTLSGPSYSGAASAGFIARIVFWLSFGALRQHVSLINLLIRKAAHLTEYAIFAVILYNSFKPADRSSWSNPSAFLALFVSGVYSLTDEFHQIFVPGRHASIFDCLIDTTGAFMGLFVFFRIILAVWCDPRVTTLLAE
jgi:VanZ family protein